MHTNLITRKYQRTPNLGTVLSVPKTILILSHSLEGFTEFKSCFTRGYGSLQQKDKSKITRGKRYMGPSPEKTRHKLSKQYMKTVLFLQLFYKSKLFLTVKLIFY